MRKNARTRVIAGCLAALAIAVATPAGAARKPNFGLYVSKYQRIVSSDAPFLVHPTGDYVDISGDKWKDARELYEPTFEKTDDMDTKVLELSDEGWVMIGYSAFSSTEAPPDPLEDKVNPGERAGTVLGMKMRGHDPYADPKGDPIQAAIWANATLVVVQEGYAFSRLETKVARVMTDDGSDTTTMRGSHRGSSADAWAGASSGSSTTDGRSNSSGDWDENHQDVGGSVGPEGGSVEGSAGQSEGSSRDRTKYNENSRFSDSYAGGARGSYQGSYEDEIRTSSHHWANALVDKHVNHYDYMVTYWKKADLSKVTFGALTETVPRELMREVGTRHARVVRAVIGGSPAYDADLWDGDVLLAIDGEPIPGEAAYGEMLDRNAGREVTLTVWRDGEVFDLPVQLNRPR